MSADGMRRAATLMRERADAATPGPWESYQNIHAETAVCEFGRGGFGVVALPATGRPDYGRANIEHLAAWDPAVARAAADLLDAGADEIERRVARDGDQVLKRANPVFHAMTELARTYLQEDRS